MTQILKRAGEWVRPVRRDVSLLSLAALVALAGCGDDGFAANENSSVLFSPLRTQSAVPTVVEDPDAPGKDGIQEIQSIVANFEQGMMADGTQAPPNMIDLEAEFIQRGRYLDLVGIYQNMIKKNTVQAAGADGAATATGPIELRLVRAYLRLGQMSLAREMLDKMIQDNADSPMTWFLNAAYWLPEAADSPDAAARVVANWQKTLEIEPNFVGFDQANAPSIREQLAVLRERTPADKIAEATAELHRKMNPNAVEKRDADAKPVAVAQAPVEEPEVEAPKVEEAPEPAVVAEVKAPAEEPAPAPAESAKPQRIPHLMAFANMALAQEQTGEAVKLFKQVLAREPEHFGAQFGLIRAGWMHPAQRPELEKNLRALAARSDLSAREELDLGRFVYYDTQDRALAIKLWESVKKKNPKLAESVGLDALIEDAKRPVE